ncbi:unnamed protein product, partial [Lampetra fluviatilis]
ILHDGRVPAKTHAQPSLQAAADITTYASAERRYRRPCWAMPSTPLPVRSRRDQSRCAGDVTSGTSGAEEEERATIVRPRGTGQ